MNSMGPWTGSWFKRSSVRKSKRSTSQGQPVYAWQDGVASKSIASNGLVGVALESYNFRFNS